MSEEVKPNEKELQDQLIAAWNNKDTEEFERIANMMANPNFATGRGYIFEQLVREAPTELDIKLILILLDTGKVDLGIPCSWNPEITLREKTKKFIEKYGEHILAEDKNKIMNYK